MLMCPVPFDPAHSITHQHIAATINTILDQAPKKTTLRILDVGCGDGKLLSHTLTALSALRPDLRIDAFGLDVMDGGQQVPSYFDQTRRHLEHQQPGIDWSKHLSLVTTRDEWPYPDASFDFVTSNQVMEHVSDLAFFLRQTRRCLDQRGVSVNLFPLREVLYEGHACMPLVHRVRNVDSRARLMLFFARLGFRKHYRREQSRRGWQSLDEFARIFSRVLQTDTNYVTAAELTEIASGVGLSTSFTYTKDFYAAKLLSFVGLRPYHYQQLGRLESAAFFMAKRVSSVTVLFTHGE